MTETDGIGEYAARSFASNAEPLISLVEPQVDTSSGAVTVTWVDEDADSDAAISLYCSTDRGGAGGILIASGIHEDDAVNSYTWDTTGVPTGDYYVYGMISDETHAPAISYATGRVAVVDPDAPAPITGLNAPAGTANTVRLTWDASTATDIHHYLVRLTSDAAGEIYTQSVVAAETVTIVSGLTEGETYRAALAAVDAEGHVGPNSSPIVVVVGGGAMILPFTGQWEVFAQPWQTYQAQVPATTGDTFTLVHGPAGAAIDGAGLFTWEVPLDATGWQEVLVHVKSADGSTSVCRRHLLTDNSNPQFVDDAIAGSATDAGTITLTAPFGQDLAGVVQYQWERDGIVLPAWQLTPEWIDAEVQPNTAYSYRVRLKDGSPDEHVSDFVGPVTITTQAAVPGAPVIDDATEDMVTLVGLAADTNPMGTVYAIYNSTALNYITADGAASSSPDWQTRDVWENIIMGNLFSDTEYEFQAQARNAAGAVTIFGAASQIRTLRETFPPVIVSVDGTAGTGILAIEFSEPVSVTLKDLFIRDQSATNMNIGAAVLTQAPGSSRFTLDLSSVLEEGQYTLFLRGDRLQDSAGNLLDGEFDGHAFPSGDGHPGGDFETMFVFGIPSIAVGHHVFYNHSAFDGNNAAADASDDNAIAPDKQPLLPGETATFANYSSYSRGLNGIMIDIENLAGMPTGSDFTFKIGNSNDLSTWAVATAPTSITARPGAGVDGSDRVTLIWADGAIRNRWLQITVLATDNTGLATPDVFYFGNALGESGNALGDALVNATDEIGARNNPHSPFNPALKDDRYDFNRDKLVNATDQIIARNNRTSPFTALRLITPPLEDGGAGAGEGEGAGDVWTTWTTSDLLKSSTSLTGLVTHAPSVVPFTSSSDPRLPALTSAAPMQLAMTGLTARVARGDVLTGDIVDSLFMLPVATPLAQTGDAFDRHMTSVAGGISPLTPLADRFSPAGHAMKVLPQPSGAGNPASILAVSRDTDDEPCPVGPVKEESQDPTRRFHWAPDACGSHAQRTLDEALHELLAEWEQY